MKSLPNRFKTNNDVLLSKSAVVYQIEHSIRRLQNELHFPIHTCPEDCLH